jgi:hypothetical protein
MFLIRQYKYILFIGCVSLLQTGCSISYSLEKSSDSVSTSLDSLASITSISTSSSGGDEQASSASDVYEEDVAAVTILYVSREESSDDYQRQVTSIARNHGISNWEQEQSTFIGMGKGLRRAGVSRDSILALPYFRSMLADSSSYSKLLKGYHM